MKKMSFVYLLGDFEQDDAYKIGVTRNSIEKRIKQLQTGNSSEIYLVDFHETDYPFFIERSLHLKYNCKQKKNEWFTLEKDDVVNFKNTCISLEERANALKSNPFSEKILK